MNQSILDKIKILNDKEPLGFADICILVLNEEDIYWTNDTIIERRLDYLIQYQNNGNSFKGFDEKLYDKMRDLGRCGCEGLDHDPNNEDCELDMYKDEDKDEDNE